jgi:pheromone a factor receptor
VFNLTAYTNGPQPIGNRGKPHHNLHLVESITRDQIGKTSGNIQLLQWYTVTACSIVFFLCFVTGERSA